MMYSNGFALAVKREGQVLRESRSQGGPPVVYLPFESEYSVFVKNTNDRRALVKVTIDGTDVGAEFVIDAHSFMDLERFVLDGDLFRGRKFKFVRADDIRVQDPTSSENGIVRVECWLEKRPRRSMLRTSGVDFFHDHSRPGDIIGCSMPASYRVENASMLGFVESDRGATVEGGLSNQSFQTTSFSGRETHSTVLELYLRGSKAAVTVNATRRQVCSNCGKKPRRKDTYCPNCGSRLSEPVGR